MITEDEIRAARVLIVDDLEANVLLLEGVLRGAGYTAVSRTTDPRAVCALHQRAPYDLILLDLQMPEMDGFEVMRRLTALEPDGQLPVLVLTAQPAHKLKALKAGARDFVSKPFDLPEVLVRVRNMLETRLLYKALTGYGEQLAARNRFIAQTFGRYLSDDVVASLLASPEALQLGGARRRVTLLMADLRGFTSLAESLPPEKVVSVVNNYLAQMIEVIAQHQGTINEFTGDGVLALFGALDARPDDAERAVACAVAMQLAMTQVNARNAEMGLPPVEMGIGVNTGDVVVGNIGSMQRAKFGVVGSAVNLTSRVESYTTGGQVMVSQSTFEAVSHCVDIEERLSVEPKGVSVATPIYSVIGIRGRPDLSLALVPVSLAPPTAPVEVRFAIVQGKDASGPVTEGAVTRLSHQGAELAAPGGAPPFANLKLHFVLNGEELAGDLYAKVSAALSADVFRVRFTSVPQRLAGFLDAMCAPEATAGALT